MSNRYSLTNRSNGIRARKLLESLMGKANEMVDEFTEVGVGSASAGSLFGNVLPENMDGLHVYPGPRGGWIADLTFRDLPPGIPTRIGTQEGSPKPTREAATQEGIQMMAMVLAASRKSTVVRGQVAEAGQVHFNFHNIIVPIPVSIMRQMADQESMKLDWGRERNLAHVLKRLPELTDEFGGEGRLSAATMNGMPRERLAALQSVAAMALALDLTEWPCRAPEASPARPMR